MRTGNTTHKVISDARKNVFHHGLFNKSTTFGSIGNAVSKHSDLVRIH
jgi:hypothetical protein